MMNQIVENNSICFYLLLKMMLMYIKREKILCTFKRL